MIWATIHDLNLVLL